MSLKSTIVRVRPLAFAALATALVGIAVHAAHAPGVGAAYAADQPKVVFYYGDSIGFESARYVRAELASRFPVVFVDGSFPGTSPCDWTRGSKDDLRRRPQPDAVIIETLGVNFSPCQVHGGKRASSGSKAYWDQYRKDLSELIGRFPESTPVWLDSPPPTRYESTSHRKSLMLKLMGQLAAARPLTWVVDSGAAVAGPRGSYATYLPCVTGEEACGEVRPGSNRVRAADGLHFCPSVKRATVRDLKRCPVYSSGAWRFGVAQATPVADYFAPPTSS